MAGQAQSPRSSFGWQGQRNGGQENAKNFWLFVLMAFYGPAITALGQLRYVEIAIAALVLPYFISAWRTLLTNERRVVLLFGLTAASQVVSDIYNGAELNSTLKRTATYLIMMILIVALRWLIGDRRDRMRWIVFGYALSYVTILFVGGAAGDVGEIYSAQPWRLGLGFAVTLAACMFAANYGKSHMLGPLALFALSIVDIAQGARATALTTLIAAILSFIAATSGSSNPPRPSTSYKVRMLIVGIFGAVVIYLGAIQATNNRLFPSEELQKKMEMQVNSPYGLLVSGRPDTAAAIYAISKNPIVGYGSSGYDYDTYVFYSIASISQYFGSSSYEGLLDIELNREWNLAIPSHSHIFGAWVDAGILAPISWLAVLSLSFLVLLQATRFKSAWSALFCFVALNNLWDLPFSPGPIRMDMAIRIVILFFALRMMNAASSRTSRPKQSFNVRRVQV
jgi:O-antigen ligase